MKLIPLTQGQFAQVDNSDYKWLSKKKWWLAKRKNTNYAQSKVKVEKGKFINIYMHRLIMQTPLTERVDHGDHNGLNCQRHNMKNCTVSQNNMNKRPYGKSKYHGVTIRKDNGRITAQIKSKFIGNFDTEIEAALAYDEKAKQMFGEFAYLNFN